MKIDVIVGLQWGDEGKGKMIDVLSPNYDVIARYQGGPNAGHTIIFDSKKIVLHTLPSGFCREHCLNIIGNGVVINPITLKEEMENLSAVVGQPVDTLVKRLIISSKASLILPTHPMLDAFQEQNKGTKKIGSTLKGIGPCYTDKTAREVVQLSQIFDTNFDTLVQKKMNKHLQSMNDSSLSTEQVVAWNEAIVWMRGLQIENTEILINELLVQGKRILAEGAQGSMLDINFGTYPYVTSSTTIASGVCQGLGVAPHIIGEVFGVFKAYTTRVGEGPFPTELSNEVGKYLSTKGNEFGSTTGRSRRCGWLDLPLLKYAIMLNGVTKLIMMKVDVLAGLDNIQVADAYLLNGKSYDIAHTELSFLQEVIPHLHTMQAWEGNDINDMLKQQSFRDYIVYIESKVKIPISHISYGPARDEIYYQ